MTWVIDEKDLKMARKKIKQARKNTVQTIKKITAIRARNNLLWMKLLKLAVETSPLRAKIILRAITKNDREVSKWLGDL